MIYWGILEKGAGKGVMWLGIYDDNEFPVCAYLNAKGTRVFYD